MKKLSITLVLLIATGFLFAQYPPAGSLRNGKPNLSGDHHRRQYPTKSRENILPGNRMGLPAGRDSWQWETLVAYDETNTQSLRYSQTFNDFGDLLTLVTQVWVSGGWEYLERSTYTYNGNRQVISELAESWLSNAWVPAERSTYTYDASGNMTGVVMEIWQASQWLYTMRFTMTYNLSGLMIGQLHESWQAGQWVNETRMTITYDGGGNILSYLYEAWEAGAWINSYLSTYTYDGSGNMLTSIMQTWQLVVWVNEYKNIFSYDANGKLLEETGQSWQLNAWMNDFRDTYSYDASGNNTEMLTEFWQGGGWENGYRDSMSYDANGNLLCETGYGWENIAWVETERRCYGYDANNNSIAGWYEEWMGMWQPGLGDLTVYSQQTEVFWVYPAYRFVANFISLPTGTSHLQPGSDGARIYPNPSSGVIRISFEDPALLSFSLSVFNSVGKRVVFLPVTDTSRPVSLGNLSEGIYLVEISAKDRTTRQKLTRINP